MTSPIRLDDAILMAENAQDDPFRPLTIFAKRIDGAWTPNTPAIVVPAAEDCGDSVRAEGFVPSDYFLELFVVREVLDGRKAQRGVDELARDEAVSVVIHYAVYDCWPVDW